MLDWLPPFPITKADLGPGRWITMDGTHVFVREGKIVRGPKDLEGHKPGGSHTAHQTSPATGDQKGKPEHPSAKNTKLPWEMSADEAKKAGVSYFRTGQGSLYAHANGQTIRVKTKHQFHDKEDIGIKRGSERTYFVHPDDASKIGMWQSLQGSHGKRVVIHGGHAHLVSQNPRTGQYGRDEKPIKLHDTPAMGLSPLELNDRSSKKGEDIHSSFAGADVWRGNHPGSPITELGGDHEKAHAEMAAAALAAGKKVHPDVSAKPKSFRLPALY